MSNEQGKEKEVTELLRDLVWLNAVIATELIQITENSSANPAKEPATGFLSP